MLDSRTDALLTKLNSLCERAGFCLVEEKELLSEGEDSDSVKGMLGYLKDRGYLEIQYAEQGEYCLRILPEGRLYHERMKKQVKEEGKKARTLFYASFWGAVLGAFVAGVAIVAVALLV